MDALNVQITPVPLKFYCFIRESSPGQKDKYGPKAQWRDFGKFCHVWPGGPHHTEKQFTRTVIESATKWERPLWQQAITEGIRCFKAGLVDAFLFGRVDRESRNPFASVPIIKEALDAGIQVYFAKERLHLDPKDPESIERYVKEIKDAITYIRKFVENTAPGRIERARDDQKHPTNTRMSGFDLIDGKRVPNQAEKAALREAAQVALKQGRPGPAARWLNDQGFRTVHGKEFTVATLAGKGGLFRNRALIGETTIHFGEEPQPVVIHHEAILDIATFEQLQDMLDERRLRAPRSDVFYALTGMLWCGSCHGRFEPTKIGNNRYYRCKHYCGEKAKRKEALEFEVYDAFGQYLQRRESQRQALELVQQSQTKLQKDLAEVERDIAENNDEWKILLQKDLADYPEIIINDKKRELTADRESLLRSKAKIESQLESLPEVNPLELERALDDLAGWEESYPAPPYPRRNPDMPRRLSDEQLPRLRETLLKLNCRIAVKYGAIFISGKLPLSVSAKKGAYSDTSRL